MNLLSTSYTIQVDENNSVSGEVYLPDSPKAIFVFAHGAGAGMNHSFLKDLSLELAKHGIATLRYNFLYMEQKKGRPDFPAVAHKAVEAAIKTAHHNYPGLPVFVGGKSFGGRMTSQYFSNHNLPFVRGIIFVGFPLHPQGKPSMDRADHLSNVTLPMLFLQGTKDALAEWSLIESVTTQLPFATLKKLEGADHSFKIPKQNSIPLLAKRITDWMDEQLKQE
jgi:predicted alpha/beta-hydrolase family hydrolase